MSAGRGAGCQREVVSACVLGRDRGRGIGKGSVPRRLGVGPPARGPVPPSGELVRAARGRGGGEGGVARRAPGAGWQGRPSVSFPAGVRQPGAPRRGRGVGGRPGPLRPARVSARRPTRPSFAPAAPGSARAEAVSARAWSRLGDACPGGGPRDAAASSVVARLPPGGVPAAPPAPRRPRPWPSVWLVSLPPPARPPARSSPSASPCLPRPVPPPSSLRDATSDQTWRPAEFKHISQRRKRN